MTDNDKTAVPKTHFFPEERMHENFPWLFWAIGWFAILKATIWLATDPNIDPGMNVDAFVLNVLGIKYTLFMIPFLISGFALWRLKKWAVWTMVVLCVMEMLFFLLFQDSIGTLTVDKSSAVTQLLTFMVFINNGPISDVIILLVSPFMFKILSQRSKEI